MSIVDILTRLNLEQGCWGQIDTCKFPRHNLKNCRYVSLYSKILKRNINAVNYFIIDELRGGCNELCRSAEWGYLISVFGI